MIRDAAPAPTVASATDNGRRVRRVFINGRFLTQKTEGVQRSAAQIVAGLDRMLRDGRIDPDRWEVTLIAPRGSLQALPLERIRVHQGGRLRGHLWEQLELPWLARRGFLVSLCNAAPVLKRRHLVTLYDAAVFDAPAGYSAAFAGWYRVLFTCLGRTAAAAVTSSEFSRRALVRAARVPEGKLRVVQLGSEHLAAVEPDEGVLDRARVRGEPFVLAVGSLNPNKNLAALLRAMEHLPAPRPTLVVAGGVNERVFRDGGMAGAGSGGGEAVRFVGYVADAELAALYDAAEAFVFPSWYEGFGFPPLEAMSRGCPALVSDIPVLREVCGEAAGYFDPADPRDIARAVGEVVRSPRLRKALSAAGPVRAARFTWAGCAAEMWRAIEEAAAGR